MTPPFSCVLLDLFGPFLIKDDCIKRGPRVNKKVWGVAFSCTSTRALYLDVAVSYNTESILHCIRRLKALRGDIKTIVSDPGSQLVGAAKELKSWRKTWSEPNLVQFGAKHGINWEFIMASSQHQNGGVEIMIKLVKGVMKSIMHQLGRHILTLNELNTVLQETANLVNSRPLGIKPNTDSSDDFLSPNSLLLGRNSDCADPGPYSLPGHSLSADLERFKLVQDITQQFWRVWLTNYFPTLLVRKKWHFTERNMKVGDVCVVQDANQLRGEFRRCRVSNVYPDRQGKVRNVEVLAASKQDGSPSYHPQALSRLRRHVRNLILLLPVDQDSEDSQGDTNTATNCSLIYRNLVNKAPSDVNSQEVVSWDSSPEDRIYAVDEGAHQVPNLSCQTSQQGSSCSEDLVTRRDLEQMVLASDVLIPPEQLLGGIVKSDTQALTTCLKPSRQQLPANTI